MKDHLIWKTEKKTRVFTGRVFDVEEVTSCSPENKSGTFSVIKSSDWAIVIPVLETERGKEFVMVWQWRHGSETLSLEFPGGVFEEGENAEMAAKRELLEETGLTPGSLIKLGEFSPNPAIMSNRVHFFLAENPVANGKQSLDDDEYVDIELVPEKEVIKKMGKEPFIHALMGTALALYLKNKI